MKRSNVFFFLTIVVAIGPACSKKKDGKAAHAALSLTNGTATTALTAGACPEGHFAGQCFTPSHYALKLLNVTVSPDEQGAQTAPAGLIWSNSGCPVQANSTEIGDKTFDYESVGDGCTDDSVATLFNFARSSDDVNTELNSQDHKILPGTYNYVQMTFCIGGTQGAYNAEFTADGMTEPYQLKSGQCGISSVAATPPIIVGEGESVTIALNYDLQNIIYEGHAESDPNFCYASEDKTVVRCFGYPNAMVPSFVKR